MSEIIPAADLQVGDVYRNVSLGRVECGQAFVVEDATTLVVGGTYRVLLARNVATGNAASIHLRSDVSVARLEPQSLSDLKGYLDYMEAGSTVSIVRFNDRFWC